MARPKSEIVIRKFSKLMEGTARVLEECFKAENMNESEYICYLLLSQAESRGSNELESEVIHLRNKQNRSECESDCEK